MITLLCVTQSTVFKIRWCIRCTSSMHTAELQPEDTLHGSACAAWDAPSALHCS